MSNDVLVLPIPFHSITTAGYVNGNFTLPVPIAGWYNLNSTAQLDNPNGTLFQLCPDERGIVKRADQTCIVPCEPAEACVGANLCAEGYRDTAPAYRCSACADNYYRIAGDCVVCPSQSWILIVLFLIAAVAVCVGGWLLNRKHVNIAFLSIGVDYFQVLAMFSNSRVQVRGGSTPVPRKRVLPGRVR